MAGRGGLFGTGFLAGKNQKYENYLSDMETGKAKYKPQLYNKASQWSDMQKQARGELGMTDAERSQAREEAARAAGGLIEAQNMNAAQLYTTGQAQGANEAMRGSNQAIAEAGAIGSAEANQLAKAAELSKTADLQARVERQQERNRENVQFLVETIPSIIPDLIDSVVAGFQAMGGGGPGATAGVTPGAPAVVP